MIQHEIKNKVRLQDKIQQADKKEQDIYDQGVKCLGINPIQHFHDVFPKGKPTELLPLPSISHKIGIIDKGQYRQFICRRIKPKEAFMQQLR